MQFIKYLISQVSEDIIKATLFHSIDKTAQTYQIVSAVAMFTQNTKYALCYIQQFFFPASLH